MSEMQASHYIYNEDNEVVAGPYANREAAEFSLRVAEQYGELPNGWIGRDVDEELAPDLDQGPEMSL